MPSLFWRVRQLLEGGSRRWLVSPQPDLVHICSELARFPMRHAAY